MKSGDAQTVLLVDDQAALRKFVGRLLSNHGYSVLEARGGIEALRLCEQHDGPIHLLLSDVIMPVMGGWELAERVKLLKPDVKVLFISGYANEVIASRGEFKHGTNFLQKPFSPEALISRVRQLLEGASSARARFTA